MKNKIFIILLGLLNLKVWALDLSTVRRIPRLPTPGPIVTSPNVLKPNIPFRPIFKPITMRPLPLSELNAFGKGNIRLPEDAKLISEAEFKKNHEAGKLHLISAGIEQTMNNNRRKTFEDNRKFVLNTLRGNREVLDRLTRKATEVTEVGENYMHTITDNRGHKQIVETMGEEFSYNEVANSLKQFSHKTNQLNLYNMLYSTLPKKYFAGRVVTAPKEIESGEVRVIEGAITSLVTDSSIIGKLVLNLDLPPAGYPASCDKEIGYAASTSMQGDQTGSKCAHHPDGIFAKVKYPMKWYATCVKNQGRRGTCVSFASTSAVESAFAVKKTKWYNLSEQNLYNAAKMKWYPSTYGDGLNTAGIMQDLVSRDYKFGFEFAWDYNPSYSRVADSTNKKYTKSCNSYSGEHCSDTNHQGKLVCTKILFWTYCGYVEQTAETSTVDIEGVSQVWNPLNTNLSVAIAKLASVLKLPMVMSIPVTPSFDNASASGYATYVGKNETNRGGHAVAVMGVVDNSALPSSAPQGAGGGYFIVKNSWGACWKDAGYVYLPIQWVKDYAKSLTVVTSI